MQKTEKQRSLSEFGVDVLAGLTSEPKTLNSRWFYDERGSELFAKIMDTEAYYPTRLEWDILRTKGEELLDFGEDEIDVVDFGAGDGRKTETILEKLKGLGVTSRYVPVDISRDALNVLEARLSKTLPWQEVHPVEAEYTEGLRQLRANDHRRRLVLFLGSNIGNFTGPEARRFLRRIWAELEEGDRLLIGFDLKKDIEALLSAYNDPDGYTREFNLNLLDRMNRELGANFDRSKFQHYGTYNALIGAMESFLLSTAAQTVRIDSLRLEVEFKAWEAVRTECSFKYLPEEIRELGTVTGFAEEAAVTDDRGWFMNCLWRVVKADV